MSSNSFDIPCPDCGRKVAVPRREIDRHDKLSLVCRHCGTGIDADVSALRKELAKIDKELANLFK